MIRKAENTSPQRFAKQKEEIDQRFPAGRFVAMHEEKIVADAETHRKLVEKIQALGKSPHGMLIIQAGVEYPNSATIFLS